MLWQRLKASISLIRPSNCSWVSGVLKNLADEVRALEEASEDLQRHGRAAKQQEAVCAALVLLRETGARRGLTHADKDGYIEQVAEILEGAL